MERSICYVFCFHNLNIYLSVQHVSKKCIHAVTNPYVTFDRATEQWGSVLRNLDRPRENFLSNLFDFNKSPT